MSKLDKYYRKLLSRSRFFSGGWGSPPELNKIVEYRRNWIGKRDKCLQLIPNDYPVKIDKEYNLKDHTIFEGSFLSPLNHYIPEIIPDMVKTVKFQFLIPKNWSTRLKPIVFHYAGTGDHNFARRRIFLGKPLMTEHSVGSLILENPFYGCRKPKEQERSNLLHVKDLFIMGGCLVAESVVLLNWCERLGFGPFVLTGLSMGGHMASLASTVWPKPIALVPCLSWTTASTVFTRGVMSSAICWKLLEEQFYSDKRYRDLKGFLKEQHEYENSKRAPEKKHINSFDSFNQLKNFNETNLKNMEVFEFMHLLMDECTHMLNFDMPIDTSLVKVVAAKDDAYVLRDGVNDFQSIWPNSEVTFIDQGHVSAFIMAQQTFRKSIIETLNKMINKYNI